METTNQMLEERKLVKELDNTALSYLCSCKRKFIYSYVRGLKLHTEATAPAFGGAIHKALDGWFKDGDVEKAIEVFKGEYKEVEGDDKRTHKMGEWILRNYDEKYKSQGSQFEVLATELKFRIEIAPGKFFVGRIDKIIKWGDIVYVLDHKTTSSLGASYTKGINPASQFVGYVWAANQLGYPAKGIIVDAILVAKGLLSSSTRGNLTPLLRYDCLIGEGQIAEWKNAVLKLWDEAVKLEDVPTGMFNQMCTFYGECPYRTLCIDDPQFRERVISTLYKVDYWNPLDD